MAVVRSMTTMPTGASPSLKPPEPPSPWLVKWYGPGWLFLCRILATSSAQALTDSKKLLSADQRLDAKTARATRLRQRSKVLTA